MIDSKNARLLLSQLGNSSSYQDVIESRNRSEMKVLKKNSIEQT